MTSPTRPASSHLFRGCCPILQGSPRSCSAWGCTSRCWRPPTTSRARRWIMFIHVPCAWLSMFVYGLMTVGVARLAGLAPSAGRRRGQGRRPDRRRLHVSCAGHRLAVGPADVGHLLGVGCAADLGADPVPFYLGLIALWRAVEDPGRARRAPPRSSRWSASSTCRSSSSRSTGGTRCTSRPRSCGLGGPSLDRSFLMPLLSMALAFSLLFLPCTSRPCATRSCAAACGPCR